MAIYNERRIGIGDATCPICGKRLGGRAEMHEVFLSRGDVQKAAPDTQARIHCRHNCVNVHPECHPEPGQEPQKTQLVRHLILFKKEAKGERCR